MSKKCWPHLETQCCQRSQLARHEKGQHTVIHRANRFIKKRLKEARRCHTHPMETWKMPGLGRHHARYVCSVTTSSQYGSAANSSVMSKTQKYANIAQTHIFTPIAIETTGEPPGKRAHHRNCRRITEVTGEVQESIYQQVSVAI